MKNMMNNINETKSITAIVPFFNEEKYLETSVERLIKVDLFNQIILVNDGSEDNSKEIAEKLSIKYDILELINSEKNFGKGYAIRSALNLITSNYVIVHDADLEYFPEDIPEMFDVAVKNPNSLVLGSRTIKGKKRENKYLVTYFANKIYTYLFSVINGKKLSDIASCYWLIKADTLKSFNISEAGFGIEVEVLSKFLRSSDNIIEVPIRYSGRTYENGKKIKFKDGISIFLKILFYSKLLNSFKRV